MNKNERLQYIKSRYPKQAKEHFDCVLDRATFTSELTSAEVAALTKGQENAEL